MKNQFFITTLTVVFLGLTVASHAKKNAIEVISVEQKAVHGTADSGNSNSKMVEADSAGAAGIAIDEPGVQKSKSGSGATTKRLLPTANKKSAADIAIDEPGVQKTKEDPVQNNEAQKEKGKVKVIKDPIGISGIAIGDPGVNGNRESPSKASTGGAGAAGVTETDPATGMAINEKGLPGDKKVKKTTK